MSELLPDYSEDEIKEASIKLVQKIFRTSQIPVEIAVSDYVVILDFGKREIGRKGLSVMYYNDLDIAYKKDNYGNLSIVNITFPEVLQEFLPSKIAKL